MSLTGSHRSLGTPSPVVEAMAGGADSDLAIALATGKSPVQQPTAKPRFHPVAGEACCGKVAEMQCMLHVHNYRLVCTKHEKNHLRALLALSCDQHAKTKWPHIAWWPP